MSVTAFIAIDEVDLTCWPYFFFLTIKFIVIPLEEVINKILLTKKFVLAHSLILIRGIINMFVFIILIPILYFTNSFEFELYIKNEDENFNIFIKILLFILYIILLFLRSFSIMKVIYFFTP